MARKKAKKVKIEKPKIEFSKLIIFAVMLMFFIVSGIGIYISLFVDCTQFSILTAFVGVPITTALGFYYNKACKENVAKIQQ